MLADGIRPLPQERSGPRLTVRPGRAPRLDARPGAWNGRDQEEAIPSGPGHSGHFSGRQSRSFMHSVGDTESL